MTPTPCRLVEYEPEGPKIFQNHSIDMVFFGLITIRQTALTNGASFYQEARPDRSVLVEKSSGMGFVGASYKEAKVCLLAHLYSIISGGEYHQVSAFAPFGCIPVKEHFSDTVGIHAYERCGVQYLPILQTYSLPHQM